MIKKTIALALMVATLSGCANLVIRPISEYNNGPYFCTSQINKGIEKGFDGEFFQGVFLPVLLIDWPFDAITDTLLWPWDAIRYSHRMNDHR